MTPTSPTLLQRPHTQRRTEAMDRIGAQPVGDSAAFVDLAEQYEALAPRLRAQFLSDFGLSLDDVPRAQGTPASFAISCECGPFLQNLVLSHRPARILALGSGDGMATLSFAVALRTLGRGTVFTTEPDSRNRERLREAIADAHVQAHVDLRAGDMFETVDQLDGSFDMVFIDIHAAGYLPLFQRIERMLQPGSIVLANNIYADEVAARPFKRYLDAHPNLSSMTLDFESGLEFTVVTA